MDSYARNAFADAIIIRGSARVHADEGGGTPSALSPAQWRIEMDSSFQIDRILCQNPVSLDFQHEFVANVGNLNSQNPK